MSSSEETSGNEKDGLQDTAEGHTSVLCPNDDCVMLPYYWFHVVTICLKTNQTGLSFSLMAARFVKTKQWERATKKPTIITAPLTADASSIASAGSSLTF